DQLVAEPPQLVLALGTTEVVTELMTRVETRLPPAERPRYLFPDGGYVPQLSAFVAADQSLGARVRGTRPLLAGPTFEAFRKRYADSFRDGTAADSVGAAAAYDAFYLAAFAIAALGPGEVVDGPAIARGLGRLVPPGAPFPFGPESIAAAFDSLARGGNADVDGASGPLDFDLASGEAPAGTLVWCPAPVGAGVGALPAPSGLSFEPVRGLIIGTLSPNCPNEPFAAPAQRPPPPPTRAP
ncbi:MAG TPA: hypothetical protein VFS00_10980, partial [Polyangiaceae bacterium]|nr:hypothetical protein [Polyangiaceae bacterium]